jgi:hypothetical protein
MCAVFAFRNREMARGEEKWGMAPRQIRGDLFSLYQESGVNRQITLSKNLPSYRVLTGRKES